jgi:hypothetical protein
MIIRFSSDADAELAEARQWYAHQREDLDLEFMDSVFYDFREDEIQVIAVFHSRRDPEGWQSRVG